MSELRDEPGASPWCKAAESGSNRRRRRKKKRNDSGKTAAAPPFIPVAVAAAAEGERCECAPTSACDSAALLRALASAGADRAVEPLLQRLIKRAGCRLVVSGRSFMLLHAALPHCSAETAEAVLRLSCSGSVCNDAPYAQLRVLLDALDVVEPRQPLLQLALRSILALLKLHPLGKIDVDAAKGEKGDEGQKTKAALGVLLISICQMQSCTLVRLCPLDCRRVSKQCWLCAGTLVPRTARHR